MASASPRMDPPTPPGTSRPKVEDMGVEAKSTAEQSLGMQSRTVQEGLGITAANNKQILEEKAAAEAKLQAGKDKPDGSVKTKAGGRPKFDSELPDKPKLDWSDKFKGFSLADVVAMFLEAYHNIKEDGQKFAQFTQKSRKYWTQVRTHGEKLKEYIADSAVYIEEQQKHLMQHQSILTDAMSDLKKAEAAKDNLTGKEKELELMEKVQGLVKGPPPMGMDKAIESVGTRTWSEAFKRKEKVSDDQMEELQGPRTPQDLAAEITRRREAIESTREGVDGHLADMKEAVADIEKQAQAISNNIAQQRRDANQLGHEYATHMEAGSGPLTRMLVRRQERKLGIDLAGGHTNAEYRKEIGLHELGTNVGMISTAKHTKEYTDEMHGQLKARVEALAKMEKNMKSPEFQELSKAEKQEARDEFLTAVKEFKTEYAAVATLVKPEDRLLALNSQAQVTLANANDRIVNFDTADPEKKAAYLAAQKDLNGIRRELKENGERISFCGERINELGGKIKSLAEALKEPGISLDDKAAKVKELEGLATELRDYTVQRHELVGKNQVLVDRLEPAIGQRDKASSEMIETTLGGYTRQLKDIEEKIKENKKALDANQKKIDKADDVDKIALLQKKEELQFERGNLGEQQAELRERISGPLADARTALDKFSEQKGQLAGLLDGGEIGSVGKLQSGADSQNTNDAMDHKEISLTKVADATMEAIQQEEALILKRVTEVTAASMSALEGIDGKINKVNKEMTELQLKLEENKEALGGGDLSHTQKEKLEQERDKLITGLDKQREMVTDLADQRKPLAGEVETLFKDAKSRIKVLESHKQILSGKEVIPDSNNPVLAKINELDGIVKGKNQDITDDIQGARSKFKGVLEQEGERLNGLAGTLVPLPPAVVSGAPVPSQPAELMDGGPTAPGKMALEEQRPIGCLTQQDAAKEQQKADAEARRISREAEAEAKAVKKAAERQETVRKMAGTGGQKP
ncbi:MAG: hypothetical protein HON32_02835 [Francisellaceae bacterium]|nr:hypothetical protein [Francisellaceae bacterium]